MHNLIRKILEILDGTPTVYGKKSHGQSLVETALMIPLLLTMLVSMVEIGWFAQNYLNLLEAAKVGARRGPFLVEENGPLAWNNAATLANIPGVGQFITEDGIAYRDLDPVTLRPTNPTTNRCENIAPENYGFYNLIACTILDTLDPLQVLWDNNKDDIAISAFSIQKVNLGDDPSVYDHTTPAGYAEGHQVVVAGRWPTNANECANSGEAPERDPFDWIENNAFDEDTITVDGAPLDLNYEMGIWDEENDTFIPYMDNRIEYQRGFVWTGQHRITNVGGGATIPCFGSEFTTEDVQELMNLPRFIQDSNPGLPGEDAEYHQRRLSHLESSGMVLVEIFWEHNLFFGDDLPVFSAFLGVLGNGDDNDPRNVIHVWAAFPSPAAEPALLFPVDFEATP